MELHGYILMVSCSNLMKSGHGAPWLKSYGFRLKSNEIQPGLSWMDIIRNNWNFLAKTISYGEMTNFAQKILIISNYFKLFPIFSREFQFSNYFDPCPPSLPRVPWVKIIGIAQQNQQFSAKTPISLRKFQLFPIISN